MNIENNVKLRLQFLARVVQRECSHLNQTTERLFVEPFSLDRAKKIGNDEDLSERLGWISSADDWQAIRQLRNQMVHDYIEDLEILTSAIQTAQNFVPTLTDVTKKLRDELQKRGVGA